MHIHIAGQQPKRQKLVSAPDPARAHQDMGQYLSGANPSAPWEAMGMSRPPVIGGMLVLALAVIDILLNAILLSQAPSILSKIAWQVVID